MALRCAVYGKPEVLALIIGEIDAGTRRLRRGRIGEDEGRYKASSIANLSKKSRVKDLLYVRNTIGSSGQGIEDREVFKLHNLGNTAGSVRERLGDSRGWYWFPPRVRCSSSR